MLRRAFLRILGIGGGALAAGASTPLAASTNAGLKDFHLPDHGAESLTSEHRWEVMKQMNCLTGAHEPVDAVKCAYCESWVSGPYYRLHGAPPDGCLPMDPHPRTGQQEID